MDIVERKIKAVFDNKDPYLDLSNTSLSSIPKEVFELTWLRKLILKNNNIKNISEQISLLPYLSELNLSENNITKFPDSILLLKNLSKLNLSSNKLKNIPSDIWKIQNLKLTQIDLSNNMLQAIPEEIGYLNLLSSLDLSNNFLTYLPDTIQRLTNLIMFDLRGNKFVELPEFLFYFKNLEVGNSSRNNYQAKLSLLLSENPIEFPPIEIISQGVIAVRNYFKELDWGEEFLYEAKLLIVGEPGAGKTTLAKCILNPEYIVDEKEKSTEGIEVLNFIFSIENGKKFHLNIWDFGGQEIYHATHQFFLTKRSLYILLSDTRAEDTNFQYWLNIVELLANNSPLIIVQNEKQERKKELNELGIRGRFSNLIKVIQTNLKTKRNLEHLVSQIKLHVTSLPHIGTKLPKSWLTIRQELEELAKSKNYISLSDYLFICIKRGLMDEERALHLSEYLHDLGVFLHFQDNPILNKIIILKPTWGTDAVYKVLDNEKVIDQKGNFFYQNLKEIWNEPEHRNVRDELLALMMKFELCYNIDDTSQYIAPQLLPIEQPVYEWIDTPNITVKYEYEFMPKGIMTRFIVRMHRYIENQNWVWKEGVILKKDLARGEIIETYGKKEIRIRIGGMGVDYRRKLLTIILEEFDKIHATYTNIRVDKFIPCICNQCLESLKPYYYKFEVLEKYKNKNITKIRCQESLQEINVNDLMEGTFGKELLPGNFKHIFVLYADNDSLYKEKLLEHLKLVRGIKIWEKSMLNPGDNKMEGIKVAINTANLILMLISPELCKENEFEINYCFNLRTQNKLDVIPITVRPGIYEDMAFSKLQSLPKANKFDNSDEIWASIIKDIKTVL